MSKGLPKRADDYSAWYNELVKKADLAENSAVRGCMVIKPYGYSIWEKMQGALDQMFKDTGHSNAYFPLFIPKSYLSREADHVEGFAKEYFYIRIWAAPATLGLYAMMGWFFGMQNAVYPLILTIVINLVNVVCNVYFVNYMGMRADGVALGTVIAQYTGLVVSFFYFVTVIVTI